MIGDRNTNITIDIWRFPKSWGIHKMDGLFHGKSDLELDDN